MKFIKRIRGRRSPQPLREARVELSPEERAELNRVLMAQQRVYWDRVWAGRR